MRMSNAKSRELWRLLLTAELPELVAVSDLIAVTGLSHDGTYGWLRRNVGGRVGYESRDGKVSAVWALAEVLAAVEGARGSGNRKVGPARSAASAQAWDTRLEKMAGKLAQ